MSDGRVELVAGLDCETGENPLWCVERGMLLFVDIPRGVIYGYDPAARNCAVIARTGVTGGLLMGVMLARAFGRIYR
jgi:sugar lactone lactonase YvrE